MSKTQNNDLDYSPLRPFAIRWPTINENFSDINSSLLTGKFPDYRTERFISIFPNSLSSPFNSQLVHYVCLLSWYDSPLLNYKFEDRIIAAAHESQLLPPDESIISALKKKEFGDVIPELLFYRDRLSYRYLENFLKAQQSLSFEYALRLEHSIFLQQDMLISALKGEIGSDIFDLKHVVSWQEFLIAQMPKIQQIQAYIRQRLAVAEDIMASVSGIEDKMSEIANRKDYSITEID